MKTQRRRIPAIEIIEEGEPKEEILKAVRNGNIDLVILLAHEEGRLEHFLYGRGTDSIIRKALLDPAGERIENRK